MKRYLLLSTMFLTLLFGFQNCTPSQIGQETGTAATAVSQNGDSSSSSAIAGVNKIEIPSLNNTLGIRGKPGSDMTLQIDINNGHIDVLDQNGTIDSSQKKCLSAAELSEVRAILSTGKMCEAGRNTSSQEVACAQYITEPYAKLLKDNSHDDVILGFWSSSCEHGPDLCGDHKEIMKSFLKAVASQINNKDCPAN